MERKRRDCRGRENYGELEMSEGRKKSTKRERERERERERVSLASRLPQKRSE